MNTKEMATEYQPAQWAQVIQERVANGESIKEFCQRRGVSRQAYFYWQRKLREIAAKQIEQENKVGDKTHLAIHRLQNFINHHRRKVCFDLNF